MSQLSLVDLAFILFQTRDTPLHVSALVELDPPADQPDFARQLYTRLLDSPHVLPPFNQRLQWSLTQLPCWQQQTSVDLTQHIHLLTLPSPGSQQQLMDQVSGLHSQQLDDNRPLWEMWVIDGAENNKVMLCIKVHHAVADGVRLASLFDASCTLSPEQPGQPFWACDLLSEHQKKQADEQDLLEQMFGSLDQLREHLTSAVGMINMGSGMLAQLLRGKDPGLKLPFTAAQTPLNQRHRRARETSLCSLPLSRVCQVSRLTGASLNDVVLTVCDMALNNYLKAHNITLDQPLVGLMPINLRSEHDDGSMGNKFAPALVEMGLSEASPAGRLAAIRHSTRSTKHQALTASPGGYYNYAIAINVLDLLGARLNLRSLIRPATNLILSNLRGPQKTRYFYGASVDAVYPLGLLPPGHTINITMYSYQQSLFIGVVNCRSGLPEAETITSHLLPALDALEQDVMLIASSAVSELSHLSDECDVSDEANVHHRHDEPGAPADREPAAVSGQSSRLCVSCAQNEQRDKRIRLLQQADELIREIRKLNESTAA